MFFNLTWRNAKRSRSENLIYFLTMITAVAMFYIVLSLGQQDVIRFLSEIESDAVERLLTNLLPTVYLCALLFVFFLVVFANKYQLECRSRELGLYLMFGMTKIKLFIQIMNEGKILLALLKNSPKIVSKKELCIRLWGTEEFIDENALQVNFTRLRKTLREFGLEERIETVRGQGYRLKEQVRL